MKRTICLILACVLLLTGCSGSKKDWQEQYDLGMRYLSEGNYEEAILAFSAAIEIDDSRPEAYMGRAEAYEGLGDHDKALRDYKRAQKIARENDDEDLVEDLEEIIEKLEEIIEEEETKTEESASEDVMLLTKLEILGDGSIETTYILTYSDQGYLQSVLTSEYTYGYEQTAEYSYDDLGRLVYVSRGEYAYEEYAYDDQGRLVMHNLVEGGASLYTYVYDEFGRLVEEYQDFDQGEHEIIYYHDQNGRVIGGDIFYYPFYDEPSTGTITYEYDYLGRLASVMETGQYSNYQDTYTYYKNATLIRRISEGGYTYAKVVFADASGENRWSAYVFSGEIEVEEENGYITRIVGSEGMEYLFFYEILDDAVPEEEEFRGELNLYKPVEYEIMRVDRSVYDAGGTMRVEHYYDQVVLLGNRPNLYSINDKIAADMENFLGSLDDYDLEAEMEYMQGTDYCYYSTADAEVTNNDGRIFSIRVSTFWFMGGVGNANHYGLSYDVTTGEAVDLPALYGMTEETLTRELKDRAWAYLSTNCADALWDSSREVLYGYTLADFYYYFQDGELVLTFPTYALSYGAAGSFTVPTGLFY